MAVTKARSNAVAKAAKGDLTVGSATNASTVVSVGTDGQVLTADAASTGGVKWAAASSGGANWTLLNSGGTTLSGSSVTISGISNANQIWFLIRGLTYANSFQNLNVRLNGDSGANYQDARIFNNLLDGPYSAGGAGGAVAAFGANQIRLNTQSPSTTSNVVNAYGMFSGCSTSGVKVFTGASAYNGGTNGTQNINTGYWSSSSSVTSINFSTGDTFTAGTVFVYTTA